MGKSILKAILTEEPWDEWIFFFCNGPNLYSQNSLTDKEVFLWAHPYTHMHPVYCWRPRNRPLTLMVRTTGWALPFGGPFWATDVTVVADEVWWARGLDMEAWLWRSYIMSIIVLTLLLVLTKSVYVRDRSLVPKFMCQRATWVTGGQ